MKRLSHKEKAFTVSPMRGVRRSGPCIMGGVSPSWYHARQSVTGPVFTGPALPMRRVSLCGFLEPQTPRIGVPASSGPAQSEDLTKACRRAPLPCPSASSLEAASKKSSATGKSPSLCLSPQGGRGRQNLPQRDSLSPRGEGWGEGGFPATAIFAPVPSEHTPRVPAFPPIKSMKPLSHKEKAFMVSPLRGVRRSGPCIMGGVSPSWYHAWQSVTDPVFTGPALPPYGVSLCGFLEPQTPYGGEPASSGPIQSQDMTKACRRAPLPCPSASSQEARP